MVWFDGAGKERSDPTRSARRRYRLRRTAVLKSAENTTSLKCFLFGQSYPWGCIQAPKEYFRDWHDYQWLSSCTYDEEHAASIQCEQVKGHLTSAGNDAAEQCPLAAGLYDQPSPDIAPVASDCTKADTEASDQTKGLSRYCDCCWEVLPQGFHGEVSACRWCTEHAAKIGELARSSSFRRVADVLSQGVERVELYNSCRTVVAYAASRRQAPFAVLEISLDDFKRLSGMLRGKSISVTSFVDRKYQASSELTSNEQETIPEPTHQQQSPVAADGAADPQDIRDTADEDMPEFLADELKQIFPRDTELGCEEPMFSRTQVQHLMQLISERIGKAIADHTKGKRA